MRVPSPESRDVPFAIGVIIAHQVSAVVEPAGWDADRLAVALAAWRAGYFLLDTFEVDADEPVTGPGWGRVWELVAATDASGLFAHGVDAGDLEPMAGDLRLLVRRVDTEADAETEPAVGRSALRDAGEGSG